MPRACIIIHLWFVFQCITSNNWLVWTRKKKRQVYRKEHSGVSMTSPSLSLSDSICVGVILSDMYTKIKDQYIHSFTLQFNSLYCCRFILCDLSKLMPEESLTNLKLLSNVVADYNYDYFIIHDGLEFHLFIISYWSIYV
jgi:hypothetical protein